MAVFADINVWVSIGVVCLSPDSFQNYVRGA